MTENSQQPDHRRTRKRLLVGAITVVLCVIVIVSWAWRFKPDLPEGLSQGEYALAASRYERQFRQKPEHEDVLMMAAELAVATNPDVALAAFGGISDHHTKYAASARLQEGLLHVGMNNAERAEASLQRFLSLAQQNSDEFTDEIGLARKWLAFLMSVQLRLDERSEHLAALHAAGRAGVPDSKQYFFPRLLIWRSTTGRTRLDAFLKQSPQNLESNIARARYLTGEGKLTAAEKVLKTLEQQFPNHPRVLAAVLECCFEQNDWDGMSKRLLVTDPSVATEPHIVTWLRGELALHEERWADAVADFQAALSTDPANPAVSMGLAKACGRLDRPDEQRQFQERAVVLSRIRVSMARIKEGDVEALQEVAGRCRRIGLTEAATAFELHAKRSSARSDSAEVSPE